MRADLGVWLGFIYLFGNIIKSFGRLHVHIESFKFSKTVDERYGCGGCTAICVGVEVGLARHAA